MGAQTDLEVKHAINVFRGEFENPAIITGSLKEGTFRIAEGEVLLNGAQINLRNAVIENVVLNVSYYGAVIDLRGADLNNVKIETQSSRQGYNITLLYDEKTSFRNIKFDNARLEKRSELLAPLEDVVGELLASFEKHFPPAARKFLEKQERQLYNSIDPEMRIEAAKALGDYIEQHRKDDSPEMRKRLSQLRVSLGEQFYREEKRENTEVAIAVIKALAGESAGNPEVRCHFWDHMSHLGDEKASDTLVDALSADPRLDVRVEAAKGLGYVNSMKALHALREGLFDRKDPTGNLGLQCALSLRKTLAFYQAPLFEDNLRENLLNSSRRFLSEADKRNLIVALSCSTDSRTKEVLGSFAGGLLGEPRHLQQTAIQQRLIGLRVECERRAEDGSIENLQGAASIAGEIDSFARVLSKAKTTGRGHDPQFLYSLNEGLDELAILKSLYNLNR